MGLATAPPIRVDLSCRQNDDKEVALLWLRADATTPVGVTSAVLTLRFDLPNDDDWVRDPVTGEPLEPERQVHVIDGGTSPGDPGGWIDVSRFSQGEVLVHISHEVWTAYVAPYTGTWDVVAVSVDAVQRCLARGEFISERGADQ